MAAGANRNQLKWLETAFLLETMDWVNVMTYDGASFAAARLLEGAGRRGGVRGVFDEVSARDARDAR
jgi:hypothetical protein